MLVRIIQLAMALYYGQLKRCEPVDHNSTPEADRMADHSRPGDPGTGDEGWMSWAWNSVIGEYDDDMPGDPQSPNPETKPRAAMVLSIGIYLRSGSVLIKSGRRPARALFGIYFDGMGIESVIQGESFFSSVFGITSLTTRYFGVLPSYMPAVGGEGLILAQVGESLSEKTAINYLFESLWDFRSSENNGLPGEYFLTVEDHAGHWTEDYHNKRFGAVFFDYTFTMKAETGLTPADLPQIENWDKAKEQSFKRVYIPQFKISFPPVLPDLVTKLIKWTSHDYLPYFVKKRPVPEVNGKKTSLEQIQILSRHLPTRETLVKVGNIEVTLVNGQEAISIGVKNFELIQETVVEITSCRMNNY